MDEGMTEGGAAALAAVSGEVLAYAGGDESLARELESGARKCAPVTGRAFTLVHGDNVEAMAAMPEGSVALVVTSPPFEGFFTYSNDAADSGNNSPQGFNLAWRFFVEQLYRVVAPGGTVVLHWTDLLAWGVKDGYAGLKEFGGRLHDAMAEAGFHLRSKVAIEKDAQAVASRMHLHNIQFATLRKDTRKCWPIRNDYLYVFQKDGDAPPVTAFERGEITEAEWIDLARGVWRGNETDVLQVRGTGAPDDTRHVCPLQLWVIDNCVRLWSNPDELVYDPYGGIGSTGYAALKRKRRYVGTELKAEYHLTAARTLGDLERHMRAQGTLFALDAAPSVKPQRRRAAKKAEVTP